MNSFKLGSLVIAEEILWVELSSSIWFVGEELIFSSLFIWFDISSCLNSDDIFLSDCERFCFLSSSGVLANVKNNDSDSFGLVWKEISNSFIGDGSIDWIDWRRSLWSTSLIALSSVVYDVDSSNWKLSSISPNDLVNWFSLPNSPIQWNIWV